MLSQLGLRDQDHISYWNVSIVMVNLTAAGDCANEVFVVCDLVATGRLTPEAPLKFAAWYTWQYRSGRTIPKEVPRSISVWFLGPSRGSNKSSSTSHEHRSILRKFDLGVMVFSKYYIVHAKSQYEDQQL